MRFPALLLLAGVLSAQQRPLALDDLAAIKTISELRVSPDGSTVVFAVGDKLMAMPVSGGEPRALVENFSNVRWSPDSRRLAYIKANAIWTIDAAGGASFRVCDYYRPNSYLAQAGNQLAWSPDGRGLAFAGTLEPPPRRTDPLVITRILYKTRTGFSDNRRMHIYVVDASGGTPRAITSGDFDHHSIDWARNGEIVFLSNRRPDADALLNYDIYAAKASESGASGIRRITDTPGVEMHPSVSPDGKTIAYTATTRKITTIDSIAEDAHVWTVPFEGGAPRELNRTLDRRSSSVQWSPDGTILYLAGDHGKTMLRRVTLRGEDAALVDRLAQVAAFSVGKQALFFTMSDPVTPPEVYRLEESGHRRISQIHAGAAAGWRLAVPENLRFKSFDGTEVEGWLYPAIGGSSPGAMILSIHGGPHGAFGWGFNPNFQIWTGRGYSVLAINPRGSSGYGQKFSDGSLNNWGGGDFKDLMAGLDHVLKTRKEIDPQRLGVTGGSYGGFMTNWAITQTSRFKAAVASASVSNLISFYATSLYQDLIHAEFDGFPWDNYEKLWQWSPLKHVKNVTTPTMFLHGELDNDVHITQAEEMYTALRQRGIEAVLVRYPREGHGLREPAHRRDALERSIAWMDRFLKPAARP